LFKHSINFEKSIVSHFRDGF